MLGRKVKIVCFWRSTYESRTCQWLQFVFFDRFVQQTEKQVASAGSYIIQAASSKRHLFSPNTFQAIGVTFQGNASPEGGGGLEHKTYYNPYCCTGYSCPNFGPDPGFQEPRAAYYGVVFQDNTRSYCDASAQGGALYVAAAATVQLLG